MNLKDRRIGKFCISRALIELDIEYCKNIFKGMFVLSADPSYSFDGIEYIGIHEEFDYIDEQFEAPRYKLNIEYRTWTSPADGHQERIPISHEWERTNL